MTTADPRTWSFPEPPDETVTALRSGADNSLWRRDRSDWWRKVASDGRVWPLADARPWPDLLRHYGPLFDATGEQ